jgi:glutathione peroxidase
MKRQLLKAIYPLTMWVSRLKKKELVAVNKQMVAPLQSIYDLPVEFNTGQAVLLQHFAGKKLLLVNTASDCGYTAQYAELQRLHEMFNDELVVIGFPANDFNEQEKGNDAEIAQFCTVNYGVSFPLAKKSVVVKNAMQHPVFKWLSYKNQNGWNDQPPSWNFTKYLVNEKGVLTHYFEPAVSPLSDSVTKAIRQ